MKNELTKSLQNSCKVTRPRAKSQKMHQICFRLPRQMANASLSYLIETPVETVIM